MVLVRRKSYPPLALLRVSALKPHVSKMASSELSSGPVEKAAKPLPFKDPNFVHSRHGGTVTGKNRTWKNLKQILAAESTLP
jgi:INO80 complex subunit C